ncbi:cubilin-like isoform X6 [Oculina patagonica]
MSYKMPAILVLWLMFGFIANLPTAFSRPRRFMDKSGIEAEELLSAKRQSSNVCGQVANNTLTSPGYPNNYPNYADCVNWVPIPAGKAMNIYFNEFDVEYHGNCDWDYLEITNENNQTIGKYCGSRSGLNVVVTGQYVVLKFHSDESFSDKGYRLTFSAFSNGTQPPPSTHPPTVPGNATYPPYTTSQPNGNATYPPYTTSPPNGGCGYVQNNQLTSPGYPNYYPNNMDCTYWVHIPHGKALRIYFDVFEVDDCGYDYLRITNERNQTFGSFCGDKSGHVVHVTGRYAIITFHSDSSITDQGYKLDISDFSNGNVSTSRPYTTYRPYNFSTSPPWYTTAPPSGGCGSVQGNQLNSPGWPNNYPNNMDCSYWIRIPYGKALRIYFDVFKVDDCGYDYLRITNERNQTFGSFCGDKSGHVVHVTGRYAIITFHSDSSITDQGYKLDISDFSNGNVSTSRPYTTYRPYIGCGYVLFNKLTSPGYPNNYPNNMDCTYLVRIPHGRALRIYFDIFKVDDCGYDYLRITNERNQTFGSFCGDKSGHYVHVTGQYAVITFHSDSSITDQGYQLFFYDVSNGNVSTSRPYTTYRPYNYTTSPPWYTTAPPSGGCGYVQYNSLTSPGYPNNYPNNMDCTYWVHIPHGKALRIHFDLFKVDDCGYDYLRITNERNQTFGEFCGVKSGHVVHVTGQYAVITFHSDSSITDQGYKLFFSDFSNGNVSTSRPYTTYRPYNYTTSPPPPTTTSPPSVCGQVVNNTLTSPGYPNNYPNNMDCVYRVPIPAGKAMNIYFNEFVVEYQIYCNYDYLEITNENNQTFGKYCGSRSGLTVVVTGQYVVLKFHSDRSFTYKGYRLTFSAFYYTTSPPPPTTTAPPRVCGQVVNNTLTSPGYPNNYPNNMDCVNWVPIPAGKAMNIYFDEFVVVYGWRCRYDYLEITNENNQTFGKYCGSRSGLNVVVTGQYVVIKFHSDAFVTNKGYRLTFSAFYYTTSPPPPTTTAPVCGQVVNNTLTSPGYPNNYPNNADCVNWVPIPAGKAMNIYFNEFVMEYHWSCRWDYLEITNENYQTFGKYCGSKSGLNVVVTGQYVVLKFYSDGSNSYKGYRLTFSAFAPGNISTSAPNTTNPPSNYTTSPPWYTTAPPSVCGQVVNNTLTSPGYPNNYPNNMDCVYWVPIAGGKAMNIYFNEFVVEHHWSCRYDYLEIINENNQTFWKYCGSKSGLNVVVTGQYVVIKFYSDAIVTRKGYRVTFSAIDLNTTSPPLHNTTQPSGGCGYVQNNTLTSPGYPNNYPNNMDCTYSIHIPHGKALRIVFEFFKVNDCGFDYLRITNERNQTLGEFCGNKSGHDVTVSGHYAVITFHSDSFVTDQGYKLYIFFSYGNASTSLPWTTYPPYTSPTPSYYPSRDAKTKLQHYLYTLRATLNEMEKIVDNELQSKVSVRSYKERVTRTLSDLHAAMNSGSRQKRDVRRAMVIGQLEKKAADLMKKLNTKEAQYKRRVLLKKKMAEMAPIKVY